MVDFAANKNYVKIKNIEDNISRITNLATNSALDAKMNKVKAEMPSITNLATDSALMVLK